MRLLIYSCLLCLSLPLNGLAAAEFTLKFATLAPPGSTWMKLLEEWDREVQQRSQGRLAFKFYPGGVQGDEPDVIKKMRFGQLHGGAFSGYGIGQMYSPARVMEVPFMFDNQREIDAVREHFTAEFSQGFKANGYRLLGWMEVGFVYFFSQQPITDFDDLKQRRIWLWQGDALGEALFRASELAPVPLSITDVFTSLSTGLIDTVYCTPLASIALQWFTKTRYMTQVPMSNAMGALIVSNRFFDSLPADLQALLEDSGRNIGQRLIEATRIDNEKSLAVLQQEGIEFVMSPEQVDYQSLTDLRDRAAAELTESSYIPRSLYERTWKLLRQLRAAQAANDHSPASSLRLDNKDSVLYAR